MTFRTNFEIPSNINDLIINHRHYNLALCLISRRPQDIPTKIVESCHFVFIFKIDGANVKKKFKDIHEGIPVLLDKLDYKTHNFITKELGEEPFISKPVPLY